MLYWEDFLDKIKIPKEMIRQPVIDIGCGPAGIFMLFSEYTITAIDPLLEVYEKDLSVFSKSNYPHVKFIAASFESFQTSETFATVFCINALNHFIDLKASMLKLQTLTKEGGCAVVSLDAHNYPFFKFVFRIIPFDILHPHQYDLKEYEMMLRSFGFSVQKKVCLKKRFFFNYWAFVLESK